MSSNKSVYNDSEMSGMRRRCRYFSLQNVPANDVRSWHVRSWPRPWPWIFKVKIFGLGLEVQVLGLVVADLGFALHLVNISGGH